MIIGQAPGRELVLDAEWRAAKSELQREAVARKAAITGRPARKLSELCGITYVAFLLLYQRRNLVDFWPGPAGRGKGDAWPAELASANARAMKARDFEGATRVVLLGRNVARCFYTKEWLEPAFLDWLPYATETGHRLKVAVCPHPSGINHWWNSPDNVKRAKFFWEDLTHMECIEAWEKAMRQL